MQTGCVYLYARVSTNIQVNDGFSLEFQKKKMEAYCMYKNLIVSGIFTDEGVSGSTMDRPEFQKLLSLVKSGDSIIFANLSRLSRDTRLALNLLHELSQRIL